MNHENSCGLDRECALQYVEQIATHKGAIDCLNGRVAQNERDIRERYAKSEVDCMLAGKADRCALEKHQIDACAHRGGCRSCDANGDEVCDCDCYTKQEIDELLAGAAADLAAHDQNPESHQNLRDWVENRLAFTPPEIYQLKIAEGYVSFGTTIFYKSVLNEVHVHFSIQDKDRNDSIVSNSTVLFTLPEGFRPANEILFPAVVVSRTAMTPGIGHILPNGNFIVNNIGVNAYRAVGSISFYAAAL